MEKNTNNQENPVIKIGTPGRAKKSNPQLTEEEMFQIINDFQASGLTRRKFCLERSYPMSNFYYWQKKYYQAFPEEVSDKPRRGRKPKSESVGEKTNVTKTESNKKKKTRKTKKGKITTDKKTPTHSLSELIEVSAEKKRPGRPRKIDSVIKDTKKSSQKDKNTKSIETEPKAKMKKAQVSDTYSENTEIQRTSGPVMQIRYPNGVRINLPADIDIKRIKELLNL